MNTVRAKFRVHNVTKYNHCTEIQMSPVFSGSDENKSFFAATPSGDIRMSVKNEIAAQAFEVNVEYYVDFTKA